MSWQATAWAERQVTGSPARKVILLVLANYADEDGICWPSQQTLSKGTEQSVDTIQRQLKKLEHLGLIAVAIRPQGRGRWPGKSYRLNMTEPQIAARSPLETEPQPNGDRAAMSTDHRAATSTVTEPQALRHEPSTEPSVRTLSEPSATRRRANAAERQKGFRAKRENVETIQNGIAKRLGPDGWLILGSIGDKDLDRLTVAQEQGKLTERMLETLKLAYRQLRRGAA